MPEKISNLRMAVNDNIGEIDVYGEVVADGWQWFDSDVTSQSFKDQLEAMGDVNEIIVNIHSPGGDVYEGVAIYNMLKRHKAKITVNIDGLCASIATIIACAGDVVNMPSNAFYMVHNAMTVVAGNHNDLREAADFIEKITDTVTTAYLEKSTKLNKETLKVLLDAESWLTAEEAFYYGFVDNIVSEKKLVACATSEQIKDFEKTPARVMKMVETPKETDDGPKVQIKLEETAEFKQFMAEIKEVKNMLQQNEQEEKPKQKYRYY